MYDTYEGMVAPTCNDFRLENNMLYHSNREETFNYWNFNERNYHNEWCCCSIDKVKNNLNKICDNNYLH